MHKALDKLQNLLECIAKEVSIVQEYLMEKENIMKNFQAKMDALMSDYNLLKSDSYFLYHYFRF